MGKKSRKKNAAAAQTSGNDSSTSFPWLDRILEALWLLTLFLIPLWFNTKSEQLFELDKVALFRSLVGSQFLLLVIKLIRDRELPRLKPPFSFAFLAFVATALLATLFAVSPQSSWFGSYFRSAGLYTTLHYFAFFLVLITGVRTTSQRLRLLYALLASASLACLYALMQYYGLDPLPWRDVAFGNRVFSTLGQPNFLSGLLTLSLPFVMALSLQTKSWPKRVGWLLLFSLMVVVTLLTRSRGGMLGLGVGVSAFAFFWAWKWRARAGAISLLLTLLLSALLTAAIWVKNPLQKPLQTFLRVKSATSQTRLYFWQGTYEAIQDRPLLGFGPDSMYATIFPYYDERIAFTEGPTVIPDRAHNWVLDIGYTHGLLGLTSFLLLVGSAFLTGWRALRRVGNTDALILSASLASLAAYLTRNLVSFSTVIHESLFWCSLALIVVIGAQTQGNETAKTVWSPPQWLESKKIQIGLLLVGLLFFWGSNGRIVRADEIFHQGRQLEAAGNLLAAITEYEQATKLVPSQTYYAYYLASAYRQQQQHAGSGAEWLKKAEATLVKIENSEGENANSVLAKARNAQVRALGTGEVEDFAAANLLFGQVITLNPKQAVVRDEWGVFLMQAGDYEAAREQFEQAAALFSNKNNETYHTIRAHLGGAYWYLKRPEDTIQTIEPIFKPGQFEFDSFPAHFFLANAYLDTGDFKLAKQQAEKALALADSPAQVQPLLLKIEQANP